MPTQYTNLYEITELQIKIMKFIDGWVHSEKTPVPNQEIFKALLKEGVKEYTTKNAINSLLMKGYIRRAVITSNKTFFVMLKRV